MRTLTQKEYEELYGKTGVNAFQEAEPTEPEQSPLSTVSSVIKDTGKQMYDTLTSDERTLPERVISAASQSVSAVPGVATAALPDDIQRPVEQVGEAIGSGFKAFTDWIGSNPALQAWTQEHPDATDALMRTLQTTTDVTNIAGTALGAKGVGTGISKGATAAKDVATGAMSKLPSAKDAFATLRPTTEQIATERSAKIVKGFEEQNTRQKTADAAFNKNTIVRKMPDGTEKTITPIDTFAENDIAPIIEKGSIQMGDYNLGEGPLGQIRDKVRALDDEIDTQLTNTGQRINIADLEQQAINYIKTNDDFRQEGTVASNVAKVQARFKDYKESYGDEVDIAELNNIRKVANRDWKPETQDTSRIVGDIARDYVYDAVPDEAIKLLLQKQGELLAAKKYAEKINGSKVTGGRVGNYAMRTAGAILGSTVEKAPVVGPIAGMLGGEAAARLMQQSQFKSAWTELRALIAKDEASQKVENPTKPQK